jgi:Rnl2 family RNA ligase
MTKLLDKYYPNFDKDEKYSWVVSEKLHGSNICISNNDGDVNYFSRNGHPLPTNYVEVLNEYNWKLLFEYNPSAFVYGEIVGKGIQKGVDYGEKKRLFIFDYSTEDGKYSFRSSVPHGFNHVPSRNVYRTSYNELIDETLKKLKTNPVTALNPVEGNTIEGDVIKCSDLPYLSEHHRFIFKVKHENFNEKKQAKKTPIVDYTDYTILDSYITENRVESAMSKYPEYTKKDIGRILKEICDDIKQEMKKDGIEWCKPYGKYINNKSHKKVVQEAI